jgi:DNA ligase 4
VRIGSGLSFADYIWVRDKPWKVWDPKSPPAFFQTAKGTQEDKGDLYLEPQEYCYYFPSYCRSLIQFLNPRSSFILKVKAAEIVPSGEFVVIPKCLTLVFITSAHE